MLDQHDIEALAKLVAKELAPMLMKKEWLSLREAAAEYHIGEHRLIKLAKDKAIKGFQDKETKRNDWIFERKSLDKYRDDRAPVIVTNREKAIAILGGRSI
jgi:hypothetical protein